MPEEFTVNRIRGLTRSAPHRKMPPGDFLRTQKQFRRMSLILVSCAALAGCGRNAAAPPSENENSGAARNEQPAEAALEQQTEQKLDPLTPDDVELYLKVMRAAAARVQRAEAGDRATLEAAKKILAAGTAGRVPTPEDVKTLERANLVALFMDQIVADDMKLDGRTYRSIAEAVEAVVPNPVYPAVPGGGRAPLGAPTPPGNPATIAPAGPPTPLETRLKTANAANQKFLAPYREEIQRLISVVRNPANLPK